MLLNVKKGRNVRPEYSKVEFLKHCNIHLTRCLRTLRARLLRTSGCRARRARKALVRVKCNTDREELKLIYIYLKPTYLVYIV